MQISTWLPYYVLAGVGLMIGSIAFVLARKPEDRKRSTVIFLMTILALVAWLGLATWLGIADVYNGATRPYPTIQFGLCIPIVLGVLLSLIPSGRTLVARLSQRELVTAQVYRVLGGIFVFLWYQGQMPALFAWPAGIGDILIGLSAPFVARTQNKTAMRLWNMLGLADLFIAVATGFMTSPSPFQMFAFNNPNLMITAFPIVLVPTFLVPASVILHIISLRKLRQ